MFVNFIRDVVTTIPTIGFNVETIEFGNMNITCWGMEVDISLSPAVHGFTFDHDSIWSDVGGRDKIRPLWRHYYQNTQGVVMVVDSNDRERISDDNGYGNSAKDELHRMMAEDELRDAVLLVFANKQDLPNAMSVEEVTERLGLNQLRNRRWYIQGCCATTGEGLYEGLEYFTNYFGSAKHKKLMEKRKLEQEERNRQNKLRRVNLTKTILLVSGWIRVVDQQTQFAMGSIPSSITKLIHWFYQDPNEHIESYPYYGEYAVANDGILEGVNVDKPALLMRFVNRKQDDPNYIVDDDAFIQFIGESGKWPNECYDDLDEEDREWMVHHDFMRMIWILFVTLGRRNGLKQIWKLTPFNTTKTYFWAQSLYFALKNSSDEETLRFLSSEFENVLIMSPCLANDFENLMKKFYSESLLAVIDGEKKEEMVLPDLHPLPSIMTDIAKLKKQQKGKENEQKSTEDKVVNEDDDQMFIESFESRSFKSWNGHRSFLRVIWCYVEEFDGGKGCVSKIRSEWKAFRKDNFHETMMYFWVHMVRYWRVMFKEVVEQKKGSNNEMEWTFNGFIAFCAKNKKKCSILNEEWWTEYYSEKVMHQKGFHDMDASQQMVLPDKKQLPQLKLVSKASK